MFDLDSLFGKDVILKIFLYENMNMLCFYYF